MSAEVFRERWLLAPLALERAKAIANDHGGIETSVGTKLITLAALGKLSVACRERTGLRELEDAELQEQQLAQSKLDDAEYAKWLTKRTTDVRARIEETLPAYQHVPSWWWVPFLAGETDEPINKWYIHGLLKSFKNEGFFTWIMVGKRYPYNAGIDVIFSDPDLQMQTVRGVYFREVDLFQVTAPEYRLHELEDSQVDLTIADFIDQAEPTPATTDDVPSSPPNKLTGKGGKIGNRHGEAIAELTIDLITKSEIELDRYTATSLAEDLRTKYAALGVAPPSDGNLERYAAGILRVCRDRF